MFMQLRMFEKQVYDGSGPPANYLKLANQSTYKLRDWIVRHPLFDARTPPSQTETFPARFQPDRA